MTFQVKIAAQLSLSVSPIFGTRNTPLWSLDVKHTFLVYMNRSCSFAGSNDDVIKGEFSLETLLSEWPPFLLCTAVIFKLTEEKFFCNGQEQSARQNYHLGHSSIDAENMQTL